ncbi:hypothetical protein MCG98_10020 [Ruminococcus sp. OA3]|uniref:hypothetical protein n=1 Tax=Ruminococcus sp. OA3 TaxID=2914164 RepID=UPI001F0684A3|nr:hypothetical protein [Ruminococcus sp. OA3]MCH1982899.1 hypothetical protein [Ruminococcus sp. OA3]
MKKHVKRALISVIFLSVAACTAVLLMAEHVSGLARTTDSVNPVMATAAALSAALVGILLYAVRNWKTGRKIRIS